MWQFLVAWNFFCLFSLFYFILNIYHAIYSGKIHLTSRESSYTSGQKVWKCFYFPFFPFHFIFPFKFLLQTILSASELEWKLKWKIGSVHKFVWNLMSMFSSTAIWDDSKIILRFNGSKNTWPTWIKSNAANLLKY